MSEEKLEESIPVVKPSSKEITYEDMMDSQRLVTSAEGTLGKENTDFLGNRPKRRVPYTYHKNLFIVHGYNSDPNNLRPWLWDVCDSCSLPRVMPEFQPLMEDANYKDWSAVTDLYAKTLSKRALTPNTMCIAHSLGTIYLIKYVAQNDIKLDTCAFLAGFLGEIEQRDDINDVVKASFLPTAEEIEKFKKNVKNIYAIYDLNDQLLNRPYQRVTLTERFDDALGAKKVVVPTGGHFGKNTKTTEIPELETIIRDYSNRKDKEKAEFIEECKSFMNDFDINTWIHIPKNGFELYLKPQPPKPVSENQQGNVVEEEKPLLCYVDATYGHDCYGMDTRATHIYYVLDGYGEFTINDQKQLVAPGDVITVYPGDEFFYQSLAAPMRLVEKIEPSFDERTFIHISNIDWDEEKKQGYAR